MQASLSCFKNKRIPYTARIVLFCLSEAAAMEIVKTNSLESREVYDSIAFR